jgi:hypothetical protein
MCRYFDKTMDWILFIFKRGFHHYLVCGESETDAWKQLCNKQSCSLEIAQKEYKLIKVMNGNQGVVKL